MTIIQEASGSRTGTGAFTVSLPAPSSASNTVVCIIWGNTTITQTGWSLRTSRVSDGGHYLFDRTGGAQSYSFTGAGTHSVTWYIAEIPGTGTFLSAPTGASNSFASGSYGTPPVTPTAGTRLIFGSVGSLIGGSVARTFSGWTNSFVERADVCQQSQDYPAMGVAVLDGVTANGSTAYSTTATFSAGGNQSASGLIAAYSTTAATPTDNPPTTSAGAAQTDVEPFSTVTLLGSEADDKGVTSRAWTKVSGPTPLSALSSTTTLQPTYQARGAWDAYTDVWRLTVTDTTGQTATATVSVSVLPATEFTYEAGRGLVAVQILAAG